MRSLGAAGLALALLLPSGAPAQDVHPPVADVPAGPGTIRGRIIHPKGAEKTAGLGVFLYGLASDGTPGMRRTRSDDTGTFRFENVANDAKTVYMIGTRYAKIPFGARVAFGSGQTVIDVEISISEPVADPARMRVTESEIRFEAPAATLVVHVLHRLRNEGESVLHVSPEQRPGGRPLFRAALPVGATDFLVPPGVFRDGLELRDREIVYWGPIYPGEQDIFYQYRLPLDAGTDGQDLKFRLRFPSGSEHVRVLSPKDGPDLSLAGFTAGEPEERAGELYRTFEASGFAPGASLSGVVRIAAARRDPDALRLTRADLWLELDPVALTVSQELSLAVDGPGRLIGSAQEPLLHLDLPPDAEVLRVAASDQEIGLVRDSNGGIDLIGPISGGDSKILVRYRLPADGDATSLVLKFPKALPLLNVLVADTGVVIENERLHRRRPVRSGTRLYLVREGYQIEAQESVALSLRRLTRRGLPRWAALSFVLLPGFAAAVLLFNPLRHQRAEEMPSAESAAAVISRERAGVYEVIRDLDHDFETGKIAETDYHRTRDELRARAIELLKHQREQLHRDMQASTAPADGASESDFQCPGCGQTVTSGWRFCPGCGAALVQSDPERNPAG